jgi:hypothetical protein
MRTGWLRALIVLALLAGIGCFEKSETSDYKASSAPEPDSGKPPWPRPEDTLARARRAGATPDRREYGTYHIHAHLDVFVNGRRVIVPAGLGIEIRDPEVKTSKEPGKPTEYGGIKLCKKACIAALHTHGEDGVVHVEAQERADFTLGQLFEVWNVRLTGRCIGGYCQPRAPIAVFVNGQRLRTEPADLVFTDGQEIAIVIGSPPKRIPDEFPGG